MAEQRETFAVSLTAGDPQKAQRLLGIPRKRCAIWGSPESAAPFGDSQKALRYLQIGGLFGNSQKAQRHLGIPRKRCAICRGSPESAAPFVAP